MRLASETGFLVAAERRAGGINVVAVGPYAPGLNPAAQTIRGRSVAAPHAGAQTVLRVVGDLDCLVERLERRHRNDGAEDLFLEDAHLIVPVENRGLHVVAGF